jgi:hypothetical protein
MMVVGGDNQNSWVLVDQLLIKVKAKAKVKVVFLPVICVMIRDCVGAAKLTSRED